MRLSRPTILGAVRLWILLSALLVGAGWVLSALRELNRTGYAVTFALAALAVILFRGRIEWPQPKNFPRALRKLGRRFKRPAPLLFLVLAGLTLAGGAGYAPMNGDSNEYRIPRVFHWLALEQWHWIRSPDYRINVAGCGFEWICTPLVLFTRTDRLLFLVNWVSYLMLPGLIFSVFRRLGVRARVAWWWAWLLPSGWCFIMQAGSTTNDSFAAIYALAAVNFALCARETRRVEDLWFSMLAAALLTGTKQTAIPLALLWFIAAGPSVRLLARQRLSSLAMIMTCLLISGLPTAILNTIHAGNWTGLPQPDESWPGTALHSPAWGIIGNAFCLAAQNFKPPVFPWSTAWNNAMSRFLQTPFGSHFAQFQQFGRLSLGVGEGNAALGSAISVLLLVSVLAAPCRAGAGAGGVVKSSGGFRLLRWAPWGLLLVFMAKVGAYENGRQLAPYYLFLVPSLIIGPGHAILVRRRWWRMAALAAMLVAAMLLLVSRERPLFPAQTTIAWLRNRHPDSKFVANLSHTFSAVSDFENQRFRVGNDLPPDEPVIGFATVYGLGDAEMWFPLGRRRLERVLTSDSPGQLRASGIRYVVIDGTLFERTSDSLQQWLARYDGTVVRQWGFLNDPYAPPVPFYLVRLQNP